MKDEWSKLYEHTFVQTTLLSPVLRSAFYVCWAPPDRLKVKAIQLMQSLSHSLLWGDFERNFVTLNLLE